MADELQYDHEHVAEAPVPLRKLCLVEEAVVGDWASWGTVASATKLRLINLLTDAVVTYDAAKTNTAGELECNWQVGGVNTYPVAGRYEAYFIINDANGEPKAFPLQPRMQVRIWGNIA